jgi:hypothetical protein
MPKKKMKAEYVEGSKALDNFKQFTSAILQANPDKKKKQTKNPPSSKTQRKSDKD